MYDPADDPAFDPTPIYPINHYMARAMADAGYCTHEEVDKAAQTDGVLWIKGLKCVLTKLVPATTTSTKPDKHWYKKFSKNRWG